MFTQKSPAHTQWSPTFTERCFIYYTHTHTHKHTLRYVHTDLTLLGEADYLIFTFSSNFGMAAFYLNSWCVCMYHICSVYVLYMYYLYSINLVLGTFVICLYVSFLTLAWMPSPQLVVRICVCIYVLFVQYYLQYVCSIHVVNVYIC